MVCDSGTAIGAIVAGGTVSLGSASPMTDGFLFFPENFRNIDQPLILQPRSGRNMSVTGMRREDAESESLPLGFTCDVALGAVPEFLRPCSIERTQSGREEMIRTDP